MTIAQLRFGAMLLFGALILGGVPLAACNRAAEGEYKTLKVDNSIASFSTEYRTYYHLDGPYVVDDSSHTFTCVEFLAPKKTMPAPNPIPGDGGGVVDMEYVPAAMKICALDADAYPSRSAEVRIQGILDSESYWPHFRLLERSTVTVAGVQAELITYESDGFFAGSPIGYYVQLSFDRNGLLWDLTGKSELAMAETLRADFDHMVETLNIVDH